jgi:hypothetical protein
VWPDLVVALEASVGDLAHLADRVEQISVKHLFTLGSAEALDVGVLVGLARLRHRHPRFPFLEKRYDLDYRCRPITAAAQVLRVRQP